MILTQPTSRLALLLLLLLVVSPAAVAGPAEAGAGDPGRTATAADDRGAVDFGVSCSEAVQDDFDRALGSAHTGELDEAKAAESRIASLEEKAREAGDETLARYIEIDRRILAGFIAHAEGDEDRAVELLRSAAELEGTVEKHPVTPGALLPPYEALGDLLHELGRPSEALEAYERSLDVWPGRYRSLAGAARSAKAAGRSDLAREYHAKLLEVAGEPAEPRPGLVEARRQVTGEASRR